MKRIVILALALITCFNAYAQTSTRTELGGARHVSPGVVAASSATFAIGMSLDGGSTFVDTARVGDTVAISGVLRPETGHVGQVGDVFIVERSDQNTFTMRTADGSYINWSGSVSALVPFIDNQILTPEITVDIFSGELGLVGGKRLFLGYVPADGILRFTPSAARVEVTARASRADAVAMFASSISSIVQTNCILCHSNGGLADGRSIHKFVTTSNPNHLSINFSQFENLVRQKGREYVLTKVEGGNGHEGGTVLVSGSTDYNNLAAFLSLLEQL